jgi:putative ABC transport system permease protein
MIAAPASYYFMQRWLNDFAYHIKLGAFVFLCTLLIMLALSWMTIGYRAYRFANSNPVDALRDE